MSVQKSLEELGTELGNAIRELPEYDAFEAATDAVEADEAAQRKIEEFETLRREFATARQAGTAEESDLVELQRTQQELHSIPVMAEYLEAQAALENRLESINEAISEPLCLDFGEFAGGCCKD